MNSQSAGSVKEKGCLSIQCGKAEVDLTSDISVIIPYYNREEFIDETLDSVFAQTLKPLEIIIVNDCSRASSRRHLDRYEEICKIVDLDTNLGLSGARNAGLQHARGRFIAFQDDDDIWLPEKLAIQRAYLEEHPECAAVHCASIAFYHGGGELRFACDWPAPTTLAQVLTNDCWVSAQTTLIRSEVIRALGGFDVRFRVCEDRDFAIRCCAAGYRMDPISEPLARIRRQGHQSLTGRNWNIFRGDLAICWKHRQHYYRAYGVRGFLSFILEKLRNASYDTPYLRKGVRLLVNSIGIRYELRSGYRDPVRYGPRVVEK